MKITKETENKELICIREYLTGPYNIKKKKKGDWELVIITFFLNEPEQTTNLSVTNSKLTEEHFFTLNTKKFPEKNS